MLLRSPTGARLAMRFELRGILADHVALSASLCLKGHSGTKFCHLCQNAVEAEVAGGSGEWLARVSGRTAGFDKRTCASSRWAIGMGLRSDGRCPPAAGSRASAARRGSPRQAPGLAAKVGPSAPRSRLAIRDEAGWQECLRMLRNAAGGPKAVLARQEQAMGLRFSRASPLFAEGTRNLLQLRHVLFDPMHLLLSGGVAVTQLCCLLEASKGLGVDPSRLDAYAACWRAPSCLSEKGGGVLPPGFFADRWVPKESRPGPQSRLTFRQPSAKAAFGVTVR